MKNERGITLVAFVVMLCCVGGAVGACPMSNTNALISSVLVHTHPSMSDERAAHSFDAPLQVSPGQFSSDIPVQIEIEELHNLPPPIAVV